VPDKLHEYPAAGGILGEEAGERERWQMPACGIVGRGLSPPPPVMMRIVSFIMQSEVAGFRGSRNGFMKLWWGLAASGVAGSLTATLIRTMVFTGKKRLSACGKLIILLNYSRCRIRGDGNG